MLDYLHLQERERHSEREFMLDAFLKKKQVEQTEFPICIKFSKFGDASNEPDYYFLLDFISNHKANRFPYIYKNPINKTRRVVTDLEPKAVENQEFDWFQKNYYSLKTNYPGKWLAIAGNKLVYCGNSFSEVVQVTRKMGLKRPFITCMSSERWEK